MGLVTEELRAQLPSLYATQFEKDPMVWARLYSERDGWAWYVTEFDGTDLCFGWVVGWDEEMGYFALSELEAVGDVERDLGFEPCRLSVVQLRERGEPCDG